MWVFVKFGIVSQVEGVSKILKINSSSRHLEEFWEKVILNIFRKRQIEHLQKNVIFALNVQFCKNYMLS